MLYRWLLALLILLGASLAGFCETPEALLLRIDQARNVPDLNCRIVMTSFLGEKVQEDETLSIQVKTTQEENKTLVWFVGPPSVKGRRMLMAGNNVYLLFPATSNPIRLSPLQVLVGEASNGDVARTGFAQEFAVQHLSRQQFEGQECWLFTLIAKPDRESGTYAQARVWVNVHNLRPLQAEFLSASGQILKKARYSDWQYFHGKQFPCRLDITDALNPDKHTSLVYTQIQSRFVPDSLFTRQALGSWVGGSSW